MAFSIIDLENINEFIYNEVKIKDTKSISALTLWRSFMIVKMLILATRFGRVIMIFCVMISRRNTSIFVNN